MSEKTKNLSTIEAVSSTEIRDFKVGDLAVYPAHGVGKIKAIESRDINGEDVDFYIMKILENDMVIMIPLTNVESVGLRDIISANDVPGIYKIMSDRNVPPDTQTWNRRYRDYMDKIKTGSLDEVAGVFRDLYLLKLTKDLSFGERKLLDTAQCLLVRELSIAKETSEETIMSEIESLFDSIMPEELSKDSEELSKEDKEEEKSE
ncbi:CarD family transcriptional regulator [Candidatus Magnetomoraceae bacterium gMMP-1]